MASILLGIVTVGLRAVLAGSTNVLDVVRDVGSGTLIGPLPANVVVWAVVAVVLVLGLRSSGLGRMIYAVGDNPIACRLAGVRVWQVLLAVYVLAGAARRRRRAAVLRHDRVGRRRPDEQLPAAVCRRHGDRRDVDPRRRRRLQRHDPRRADPRPCSTACCCASTSSEAFKQMLYGVIVLAAGLAVRPPDRSEVRRGRAMTVFGARSLSGSGASETVRDGVGVIGTGFMGVAHTEALRRLGLDVVGIVGSTPDAGRGPRRPSATAAAASSTASRRCSPTRPSTPSTSPAPTTSTPSTSGRRSPPASTSCARSRSACRPTETADLRRPRRGGRRRPRRLLQHPLLRRRTRTPRRSSRPAAIGEPRFVTGRYHQDWLLLDTDWNWRLDAARQGGLRAVADIGSHWLDLARFVTGRHVVEVFADLHTFVTERDHPVGEVETFGAAAADDAARVREHMESDDAAGLLLRFEDGAARRRARSARSRPGARTPSSGRSTAPPPRWRWASEDPERLWIGHRGRPNEVHREGPGDHDAGRRRRRRLPGRSRRGLPGHVPRPCSPTSTVTSPPAARHRARRYPTFADGHDAVLVGEAISASARTGTWAKVERT